MMVSVSANTVLWLLLTFVFLIVEACTVGLISVWFAIGAFCALLVSIFKGTFLVQCIVFVGISVASLTGYIIWMKRFKKEVDSGGARTRIGEVVGKDCIVIEPLDKLNGTGRVAISGMDWKAEYEDSTVIPKGETVRVTSYKGVTLYVERKENK